LQAFLLRDLKEPRPGSGLASPQAIP
jgi:hypothetical protein